MDVCNQLILKHDKDHSGSIDFNEFNSILQEVHQWIVLLAEWTYLQSVFQFFDSDRSGRMEFNEFSHAMVKMGYQFNQQIIALIFTNLDQNRAGFLDLDGFIKACSVIQIVLIKMQQYDPQRRGIVTLDVNQLLDVVFSIPM